MVLPNQEKTDRQQVTEFYAISSGCNNLYKLFIFAPFTS